MRGVTGAGGVRMYLLLSVGTSCATSDDALQPRSRVDAMKINGRITSTPKFAVLVPSPSGLSTRHFWRGALDRKKQHSRFPAKADVALPDRVHFREEP